MRKIVILFLVVACGCDPLTTIRQVESNPKDKTRVESQRGEAWKTMDENLGLRTPTEVEADK